jgi:ActR/RegA family two-component response regulator
MASEKPTVAEQLLWKSIDNLLGGGSPAPTNAIEAVRAAMCHRSRYLDYALSAEATPAAKLMWRALNRMLDALACGTNVTATYAVHFGNHVRELYRPLVTGQHAESVQGGAS